MTGNLYKEYGMCPSVPQEVKEEIKEKKIPLKNKYLKNGQVPIKPFSRTWWDMGKDHPTLKLTNIRSKERWDNLTTEEQDAIMNVDVHHAIDWAAWLESNGEEHGQPNLPEQ